jgi:menaquinone-9 beta-reductase
MQNVSIIGGAIAGSLAALSARRFTDQVTIWERSKLPRHKVCGEFLSGEIQPILQQAGVWNSLQAVEPARLDRVTLVFGRWQKTTMLPETAIGISRFALDQLLFSAALEQGVTHQSQSGNITEHCVLAAGRSGQQTRGNRLFGFKAHHRGLANRAVELYFFDGGYVGINSVENGLVNVCGLAREDLLRQVNFRPEALFEKSAPLMARHRELTPEWDWLHTGPLIYGAQTTRTEQAVYAAGDALRFVDPFTGSGQLAAAVSGWLAGESAAKRHSVVAYEARTNDALGRPFWFSSAIRYAVLNGWANLLGPWAPADLLYRFTRPRVSFS